VTAADPTPEPYGHADPTEGRSASPARTSARDLWSGVHAALATAALGLPVGALWGWLAPREDVRLAPGGAVSFVNAGGDLFVGADLLYALLAVVVGLAAGTVAHQVATDRGWPVVAGLAVGGVLAALLAVRLGEWIGTASLVFEQGQLLPADGRPLPPDASGVLEVALTLRATGAVVLLPLSAVLAHLSLQLARPRPEPGTSRPGVTPPGGGRPGVAPEPPAGSRAVPSAERSPS
jgi:hypothetical protein